MRRVRIAKITSVCVASDSTNQPERNWSGPAWNDPQHDAEGHEVEHRAQRPEEEHEPADERDVPVRRSAQLLLVDVVGGDGQLAGVVEQVVEQDLRRQHRQERQEQRRAGGAMNMLPKLLDVPISTYLMVLAKIRRPSATPSASTSRSFSSRMTSAASLATSVAESTEMPTSAACSASASLTPSPRNATPPPLRRWTRTMRALCSGLTRANTVVRAIAAASCGVVERVDVGCRSARRRRRGRGRGRPWRRPRRCRR